MDALSGVAMHLAPRLGGLLPCNSGTTGITIIPYNWVEEGPSNS